MQKERWFNTYAHNFNSFAHDRVRLSDWMSYTSLCLFVILLAATMSELTNSRRRKET